MTIPARELPLLDERDRPTWRVSSAVAIFVIAPVVVLALTTVGGSARAMVRLVFLLVIVICMLTERNGWALWKRVLFVPTAYLAALLWTVPIALAVGPLLARLQLGSFIDVAVVTMSSVPVALYAMWRSKVFVRTADSS